MTVKGYRLITRRLSEAERLLKENGGRIVSDIHDPKLTHIIMDDDDGGRYAELSRKTSKWAFRPVPHAPFTDQIVRPKRKHIVLPSWVHECVDEETLMNEDGQSMRSSSFSSSLADYLAGHKPK